MTKARELALLTQSNPGGFAATARREARQILSGSQYRSHPERSFRPLAGVLGAIGRFFDRVVGPLGRFLENHIWHPVSGPLSNVFGDWWPILVLAAVVVAGVLVGRIVIRRRALVGHEAVGRTGRRGDEDPDELEAMAHRAELDGDMQAAVRLRFRAGVTRLERLGAVNRGPTRTDRELSGSLKSATFDALAADLESIVYGGEPATGQQAAEALSGWREVTLEAARNLKTAERTSAANR